MCGLVRQGTFKGRQHKKHAVATGSPAFNSRSLSPISEGVARWFANGPENRGCPMHSDAWFDSAAFRHFPGRDAMADI